MMRYVIPSGDTELVLTAMGCNHPVLSGSPGSNIFLFFEENDELTPETIHFKLYETGEAVEGSYIGTITDGKVAKHLYWANYFEGFEDDSTDRHVRVSDEVPEVQASGSDSVGPDAQGSREDV